MTHQIVKLKQLPVNKTVVFWSPIEGDDVMVRTGTIAEGSCFFHSLLHGYSGEYSSLDRNGCMRFVRILRASMAEKITRERWEDLGDGLISRIPFQEKVLQCIHNFYEFLEDNKSSIKGRNTRRVIKYLIDNEKALEVYRIIKELIPDE